MKVFIFAGSIMASQAPVELYWDAEAGELREKPKSTPEDPATDAVAEKEGENTADAEGSEEEEESESEEESADEVDDASTPTLIKKAVEAGGDLAKGVVDQWVLDQATGLSFIYVSDTSKMLCWNPQQKTMFEWHGPGKLVFAWAASDALTGPPGTTAPTNPTAAAPATASADADAAMASPSAADGEKILMITVIPPSSLYKQVVDERETIQFDVPAKAVGRIVGKDGANLSKIREFSKAQVEVEKEEKANMVYITGKKDQVHTAQQMIDKAIYESIGAGGLQAVKSKIQRKAMKDLKKETAEAAASTAAVDGMPEFAAKWSLDTKTLRWLKKNDLQLQRYVIKHFNPLKAKAKAALRKYVARISQHPQKWRLEAMHEDGDLEDVCETSEVADEGSVVGLLSETGEPETGAKRIDLEGGDSKAFGDVQAEHCRFMKLGDEFYMMALESHVGTVVDGRKWRSNDGPIPLRDGSTVEVGKYMLYIEFGAKDALLKRRARLVAGERFWRHEAAAIPDAAENEEKASDEPEDGEEDDEEEPTEGEPAESSPQAENVSDDANAGEDSETRKRKVPDDSTLLQESERELKQAKSL